MSLPPDGEISTWRAVLQGHSALMRIFEREMRQSCGISLAWYDVLIHLGEAPQGTLRMAELAERLLLSPSWLTRRIDGMQEAGLVERCRAAGDGRGVCVALTPEGRLLFRRAARSHGRSISEHFGSHLDPAERQTIQTAFTRVGAAARSCDPD